MQSNADSDLPCSLLRRGVAIAYDTIVVLALWFTTTAILLLFTGAQAIEPGQAYYILYWPFLLLVNWFYLALSWRHGNQTLGMKAWRLYLHSDSGERLSWGKSALRYAVALAGFAILGSGFFSSMFRTDKRTWQDRASHSWPVYRARNN